MRQDAYSVDVDDLAVLIADLARGHEALGELAVGLERCISPLQLTWQGEAAEAHRAAQAAWNQGFHEMRDALSRMRQVADTAHRNYTLAAETNQKLWEQVR
jgi:WXG100 family type VII secretion target